MFNKLQVVTMCLLLPAITAWGQMGKGMIAGEVRDAAGAALPGARIDLDPQVQLATSDTQAAFSITDLPAGTYGVKVSYVGFAPYAGSVTATLQVAGRNDDVIVTADRPHGEPSGACCR